MKDLECLKDMCEDTPAEGVTLDEAIADLEALESDTDRSIYDTIHMYDKRIHDIVNEYERIIKNLENRSCESCLHYYNNGYCTNLYLNKMLDEFQEVTGLVRVYKGFGCKLWEAKQ